MERGIAQRKDLMLEVSKESFIPTNNLCHYFLENSNTIDKLMAKFKPGFWRKTKETERDYRLSTSKKDNEWVEFNTYAELRSNLKKYLDESPEPYISVYRSRRGEFGEWYEHWALGVNGKPKIIKSGWQ